jgi:hypothetical protein
MRSFVSGFEERKSFNETDLASLGLDLDYERPLLPLLHSVLSDAPLSSHSKMPIPECYKVSPPGSPQDKLTSLSGETLIFIFETEARTPLQRLAAEELKRRKYVLDEDTGRWQTPKGGEWNVEEWKETVPQGADAVDDPKSVV